MTEFLKFEYEAGPIHVVMWEVLYLLVLVLVLSWLLNRWLFQPILGVLDARKKRIDDAAGAQDDMLARIDEMSRAQAERLAEARRAAVERVESAKAAAEGKRAEEVAHARDQAEHRIEEAQGRVDAAAASAEKDLRRDVALLAKRIASQVLGREVA